MTKALLWAAALGSAALAVGCDGGEEPRRWKTFARSLLYQGTYFVSVQVEDPEHALAIVKVTGSGAPEELELLFEGAMWTAKIPLGPTPPALPLTYDLAINDGRIVVHQSALVTCLLEHAPVPLSPAQGDVVESPVTYRWIPIPGTGVAYRVYAYPQQTVVDGSSLTVATPPGTYSWFIEVYAGQDDACGARADGGIFTVR